MDYSNTNCTQKIVIFGAGGMGRRTLEVLSKQDNIQVIAFVDNDQTKHGQKHNGVPIYSPAKLTEIDFDFLHYGTQMGINEIGSQIAKLGIPAYKVKKEYIDTITNARKIFVERFAQEVSGISLSGSIAEAGVYRGEFARYLNLMFPENKFYLFDTFSGFNPKDFLYEEDDSLQDAAHFMDTSRDLVLSRMPHPKQCVIKEGYFPDTLKGIEDQFVFISLDLDLYKPTLAGLEYFYPRMMRGGCILIHDYFTPSYPNVKKAVTDYEKIHKTNLYRLPIGDDVSIAVIKI